MIRQSAYTYDGVYVKKLPGLRLCHGQSLPRPKQPLRKLKDIPVEEQKAIFREVQEQNRLGEIAQGKNNPNMLWPED